MKTSETLTKLAPALLAAQKTIGNAKKQATNPHYKTKYANLESVIEATKDALNDQGIVIIQSVSQVYAGAINVVTRLMHESGEYIEDIASAPLTKQDAQGVGSAVTYLRRYSLAAICSITQEDDDGESAKDPAITKAQLVAIQTNAEKNKDMIEKALIYFKASDLTKLSQSQANIIINKLN